MMWRPLAAIVLATPLAGGCVAAIVPVAAAALAGRKALSGDRDPSELVVPVDPDVFVTSNVTTPGQAVPAGTRPTVTKAGIPVAPLPRSFQFLYGSAEGAAVSEQAYHSLTDFIHARADDRIAGYPVASVVLAPGSTLAAPKFTPCDDKPLAVVFDIDETSILNLGYEADEISRNGGYDEQRWQRWEATGADAVVAVPGVLGAVKTARDAGIVVIFNSNRTTTNAAATADALYKAGLGRVELGNTLFLRDPAADGAKDVRRANIGARFCVVALVGDQLGDFTDLFDTSGLTPVQRREAASGIQIRPLWGSGWFILPNPVYGTATKGGLNEVFPADKRWTDPGAVRAVAPAPAAAPVSPPTPVPTPVGK